MNEQLKFENLENTSSFGELRIKKRLQELLNSIEEIDEVRDFDVKAQNDKITISGTIVTTLANVGIKTTLENDGLSLRASQPDIDAPFYAKGKANKLVNENIGKLPEQLKDFLEKETGQTVNKIWIADGKLHAQHPEKPAAKPLSEEETAEKFGPKPSVEIPTPEGGKTDTGEVYASEVVLKPEEKNPEKKALLRNLIDQEAVDVSPEESNQDEISFEKMRSTESFNTAFINELIEEVKFSKNFEVRKILQYTESDNVTFKIKLAPPGDEGKEDGLIMTLRNSDSKNLLKIDLTPETELNLDLVGFKIDLIGFEFDIEKKLAEKTGKRIDKIWIEGGKIHVSYDEDVPAPKKDELEPVKTSTAFNPESSENIPPAKLQLDYLQKNHPEKLEEWWLYKEMQSALKNGDDESKSLAKAFFDDPRTFFINSKAIVVDDAKKDPDNKTLQESISGVRRAENYWQFLVNKYGNWPDKNTDESTVTPEEETPASDTPAEENDFVAESSKEGKEIKKLDPFKKLETELLRIENAYNKTFFMTFKDLLDALPERKAAYAEFIKKGVEYETKEGTELNLDPEDDLDEGKMMNIANALVDEMNKKFEEDETNTVDTVSVTPPEEVPTPTANPESILSSETHREIANIARETAGKFYKIKT